VLVMRKMAATTESAFLRALDWLRCVCVCGWPRGVCVMELS
jgi:hypothetical protein